MLYKLGGIAILAVFAIMLTGCGAMVASPVTGGLSTNVSGPVGFASGENQPDMKVGTGSVTSILGIVASGDASIRTAAQRANIRKIYYVDYKSTNILGIYATYTIYVYGGNSIAVE